MKFKLPKSQNKPFTKYIIPSSLNKGLLIGDVHIPYHDETALEITLERAYRESVDFIFLGGDIMDCYSISNFSREPTRARFKEEVALTKEFFNLLRSNFQKAKIIYKIGNHEERLWTYLVQKAPEIFDLDELKMENLLGLDEYDIDCVNLKRISKYYKLHIIHGHEYRFSISNPVNPARGLFLRTKQSALCFHFHQTSEHTESTIGGKSIGTFSVGCLCDLTPEYMPLNKWNHGFALVSNEDNYYMVDNKRIIGNKIV